MVVVTIISVMMTLAVPAYDRVRRRARAAAVANDFRVFASAFEMRAHEKGTWPAEAAPGVVPDGMADGRLNVAQWAARTPMGGKFDWENNQVHPGGVRGGRWTAAIAITGTSDAPLLVDADLIREIDRELDDGELESGNFRLSGDGGPLYILEP